MKFRDLENIVQKLKKIMPEDAEIFLLDENEQYINLGDISTGLFVPVSSAENEEIEIYDDLEQGEKPNCVLLYPESNNDIN